MPELQEATCYGTNQWMDLKPLDIKDEDLKLVDWDKYYKQEFPKNQIVLHHTVSGPGTRGDLATWAEYESKIGTCIIVERDGTMQQLFSSRYWAYHLGAGKPYLDKTSIAIELDNWGQLEERDGKLFTVYGNEVDVEVVHYPEGFRGEQLFEAYPIAQLRAVGELLLLWNKTYDIPLDYHEDMWDLSKKALRGDKGVWTHVSYRPWPSSKNKWDCHPDGNLVAMLRSLKSLI